MENETNTETVPDTSIPSGGDSTGTLEPSTTTTTVEPTTEPTGAEMTTEQADKMIELLTNIDLTLFHMHELSIYVVVACLVWFVFKMAYRYIGGTLFGGL